MNRQSTGLTHLAYQLPDRRVSLEDLERDGSITSSAAVLRDLGFEHCHIHTAEDSFEDMVVGCADRLLGESGIRRDEVQWLLRYAGLDATNAAAVSANGDILNHFRYPVAHAQHRLELSDAGSMAIGQQGCSGLLSSIYFADRLLGSSSMTSVLCLAGDPMPAGSSREVLYNVMSDACAAVLIEKNPAKNGIIHFHQHTVPYYWNTPDHKEELLASYFPLAQRVIMQTLDQAGIAVGDIAWFVPHNVNYRSWKILSELLQVPEDKIWSRNIARVGHTISCDHIINLRDMEDEGVLNTGDVLVMFTFGFGANWSCMIVEH